MSLSVKLTGLVTRVSTELKAIRTLINGNATDLTSLNTTAKANLVAAINEVFASIATERLARNGIISDADPDATSFVTTASNAKIRSLINAAVASLVNGSPALLDNLNELATAIGDDPNFAATMSTALGNRLRVDAAQSLTSGQQAQGRSNLDVYSTSQIGDPEADFVSVFNAGLS